MLKEGLPVSFGPKKIIKKADRKKRKRDPIIKSND